MTCRLTLQKGLQVSQLMCDLPILHITRRCGSRGIILRREVCAIASVLPDRTTQPDAHRLPDRKSRQGDEFQNYEFDRIMRGNLTNRQHPRRSADTRSGTADDNVRVVQPPPVPPILSMSGRRISDGRALCRRWMPIAGGWQSPGPVCPRTRLTSVSAEFNQQASATFSGFQTRLAADDSGAGPPCDRRRIAPAVDPTSACGPPASRCSPGGTC